MEITTLIAQIPPVLIYLAVIVLCIVDRIRIASFLTLMTLAFYPMIVGMIYQYAYPAEKLIVGSKSPYVLFAITVVMVVFLVAVLLPSLDSSEEKKNDPPGVSRWVLLATAFVAIIAGLSVTLASLYFPGSIGLEEPGAALGITVYNLAVLVTAALFYFASRKNSQTRPNLMRKIILPVVFYIFCPITLALSLIIIYAFPSSAVNASYPTAAAYNFIANIVLGTLVLLITRDAVPKSTIAKAKAAQEPAELVL